LHFPLHDNTIPILWNKINLSKENFVVKIADFGFAKSMDHHETADRKCGTPLTMAPEVMRSQPYSYKRDVWALGAIFYQLITGKYVFGHELITIPELEKNMENGSFDVSKDLKVSL